MIGNFHKLAIVGLGYVGLPVAIAFDKKFEVIGFDNNREKIELYKNGIDPTGEIGNSEISNSSIVFTSDERKLSEARFIIVAVPTPINNDFSPNLTALIEATKTIGRNLSKGSIVVYESTVYPGCTEEICVKLLEEYSGLICGTDFNVGYSPERINPSDKLHTFKNIKKIVSGNDSQTLEIIKQMYELVVETGTYPVSNIKTAEAIKVIENSQRDINIAFMNEVAMILNKMKIDTNEVIDGMNTKWNKLGFKPGLVGGHCISVDPYYLIDRAKKLGYESQVIASARKVNDNMGKYIANITISKLLETGQCLSDSKVVVLGFSFKENCSDIRNTRVYDIVKQLESSGIETLVVDPMVDKKVALFEYGININQISEVNDVNGIVAAVAHDEFKKIGINKIESLYGNISSEEKIFIDVKGLFSTEDLKALKLNYWRL